MNLKLHPLAENDLKIALNYYYEISPKLEKRFISHLDKLFNSILSSPDTYPYETQTSQKVVMKKFPYIIIYEQYEDIVVILAIFHTRQNPTKLIERHSKA
ncbi:type II toxin-antitoxin system RelE/ParE family toxin [Candidatus Sulfurimonas marisnigri]|uniref:Type II toxin-antitoxin system RelE/ParE family toxin n=1 Tax=Candidatus Sulfurimonas marisnigri TaxID=2740405 RepID=A0A7S7LY27_9BACT|nr:type II toxin-antitoxin system RelE/ParE family toxin [Candidatus Sulfurimonas marisnigri]QOY53567.1 type II toxin-antitoxin system RelE/ParE family toxin [Candidatus Sulfurimonas marisnigri]